MKILAIDTSSVSGSIALLEDRRLVGEWTAGDAGKHSIWLLASISSCLESLKISVKEIDLFAVDTGPGSFTGLRIGISTVKGIARALDKKTVGVSTLKALSMNLPYSGKIVCPLLDARKGEVYSALYDTGTGMPEPLLKDSVLKPQALFDIISERGLKGRVIFLGDGLKTYSGAILNDVEGAVLAPEPYWRLKASHAGLLAFDMAGEALDARELAPVYLRKSEAEIRFPVK